MKPSFALIAALALGGVLATSSACASMQWHDESGCVAWHMADKKLVGPSYNDGAAKYKGRADAVAYLSSRARQGGPGSRGTVPMPNSSASAPTQRL